MGPDDSVLSLYVHIPFCSSKCEYCDFASFTLSQTTQHITDYFDILCVELQMWLETFSKEMMLKSVYIGGGTPSVIKPECYENLMALISPRMAPDCEFTCEVNPGSVDVEFLRFMKEAGCNRISMGLQSPSDDTLRLINRNQTLKTFFGKYERIRALYDNVNVDFICGLPESLSDWLTNSRTLVAALQPEHVSVYILEAEKETPLSLKYAAGKIDLPSMAYTSHVFEEFAWALQSVGYNRYEISNFSKPGRESRHNRVYWDYGQYIGIGLSAGGHVRKTRYVNTSVLKDYLSFDGEDSRFEYVEEKDTTGDIREMIFMGLRHRNGVSTNKLSEHVLNNFNENVYKGLETLLFLMESSVYFTVEQSHLRLNDYYFIHNREAFEYFIEVFEKVFQF